MSVPTSAARERCCDIAVVGAGLDGLAAARELYEFCERHGIAAAS